MCTKGAISSVYKVLISFIFSVTVVAQVWSGEEYPNGTIDNIYVKFFVDHVEPLFHNYRLPRKSDFISYWAYTDSYIYKTTDDEGNFKKPYWTKGDFNGDKKTDFAYVLVNKTNSEKILVVLLSSDMDYIPIKLATGFKEEMGVATQKDGYITTLAGQGYDTGAKGLPERIKIETDAIAFFEFEGAASVFVWDSVRQSFSRYWISD